MFGTFKTITGTMRTIFTTRPSFVIIIKTKVLIPQAKVTLDVFGDRV